MIEWIKKQYISIILLALFGVFAVVRVQTLNNETSSSPVMNLESPDVPTAKHLTRFVDKQSATEKKATCVGADCTPSPSSPQQSQNDSGKVTTETQQTAAQAQIVEKEKACDQKFNESCIDLAVLMEEQGNKKEAIKFLKKACSLPEVDIHACGEVGRLFDYSEMENARRKCDNGSPTDCLQAAGYYFHKDDKARSRDLMSIGCNDGLTEACVSVGFLMSPEESKVANDKCNSGSAKDCLYVAGQLESGEKTKQRNVYFLKACELGDQTSCIYAGEDVPKDKVNELTKSCFDGGKVSSCMLLIGKNSADSSNEKESELQDRLIRKACDLGNPLACNSLKK